MELEYSFECPCRVTLCAESEKQLERKLDRHIKNSDIHKIWKETKDKWS